MAAGQQNVAFDRREFLGMQVNPYQNPFKSIPLQTQQISKCPVSSRSVVLLTLDTKLTSVHSARLSMFYDELPPKKQADWDEVATGAVKEVRARQVANY